MISVDRFESLEVVAELQIDLNGKTFALRAADKRFFLDFPRLSTMRCLLNTLFNTRRVSSLRDVAGMLDARNCTCEIRIWRCCVFSVGHQASSAFFSRLGLPHFQLGRVREKQGAGKEQKVG